MRYNSRTSTERLELCWASKASTIQRKGRVGRVSDGFSFKLIPQEFYMNSLADYS